MRQLVMLLSLIIVGLGVGGCSSYTYEDRRELSMPDPMNDFYYDSGPTIVPSDRYLLAAPIPF